MKILMYGKYKPFRSNGVYTAIEHLTKSLVTAGHQVHILNPSSKVSLKNSEFCKKNGFRLSTCRGLFGFWSIINFFLVLYNFRPDVIHFQYVRYPSQLLVVIICKCLGIYQILSVHDGYSKGYFQKNPLKKYVYFYIVDFWMLNLVDHVHCVSLREQQDLERWTFNKHKFTIIQNVYVSDAAMVPPISQRGFSFSFLGRVDVVHKNLTYQAELIDHIAPRLGQKDFHLCGPLRNENVNIIADLNSSLGIDLILHEPMFGSDKSRYLQNSKLFMHASKWELFGYSMLEAIDAGCHLVISRNCDLLNILQDQPFVSVLSGDFGEDQKVLLEAIDLLETDCLHHKNRGDFLQQFNNSSILESYEKMYHGATV
ncbi:glycosyltransferase family 4 protein [Amylibacter sp.]|nr:glycosyltransferase family 4 protein [Amylibacter sp.]